MAKDKKNEACFIFLNQAYKLRCLTCSGFTENDKVLAVEDSVDVNHGKSAFVNSNLS